MRRVIRKSVLPAFLSLTLVTCAGAARAEDLPEIPIPGPASVSQPVAPLDLLQLLALFEDGLFQVIW